MTNNSMSVKNGDINKSSSKGKNKSIFGGMFSKKSKEEKSKKNYNRSESIS